MESPAVQGILTAGTRPSTVGCVTEPNQHDASNDRRASVFLRINSSGPPRKNRVVAELIEIDSEGGIPREVGLAEDGEPIYVTRPGEYGLWNDSSMPLIPPKDPRFQAIWGREGGSPIDAEEFESTYAKAAATLPHTVAGTPLWMSHLVAWVVILAVIGAVVGVLYLLAHLLLR